MNTQRPEWNDANNALVGYGVSMVTLYYLNRYLIFFNRLLVSIGSKEIIISKEVNRWFESIDKACQKNKFYLDDQTIDPKRRKRFVEELQSGFSKYRKSIYDKDSTGDTVLGVNRVIAFNTLVLKCFKISSLLIFLSFRTLESTSLKKLGVVMCMLSL